MSVKFRLQIVCACVRQYNLSEWEGRLPPRSETRSFCPGVKRWKISFGESFGAGKKAKIISRARRILMHSHYVSCASLVSWAKPNVCERKLLKARRKLFGVGIQWRWWWLHITFEDRKLFRGWQRGKKEQKKLSLSTEENGTEIKEIVHCSSLSHFSGLRWNWMNSRISRVRLLSDSSRERIGALLHVQISINLSPSIA